MARIELIMPKMGESVSEATIISWNKNIGDLIEIDDTSSFFQSQTSSKQLFTKKIWLKLSNKQEQ